MNTSLVGISSVWPELESASTTSLAVSMPRLPWLDSTGWAKNAGQPVLASVHVDVLVAGEACPLGREPAASTPPAAVIGYALAGSARGARAYRVDTPPSSTPGRHPAR